MAEYKTQFPELGFYVNGERKQFSGGRYATDDKAEMEVLDKLADATKIEAVKQPAPKPKATAKK